MHVVTKFLVVFCAILALVLSALTMAYAANAEAIKSEWKNERAMAIAAKTEAGILVAQAGTKEKTLEAAAAALQSQLSVRTGEVSTLQAERTTLRTDLERANAEKAAIQNQIAQLGATAASQAALITAYRTEVTDLREGLFTAAKHEAELVDRINDLESAREVLEQNARALKEQLEETKLALQNLQSGGTASAADTTPRILTGPLIQARVSEVYKTPAGADMVVITEGANRGLRENTIMNITRGGNFVADIVLVTVEPTRAVGRITLYKDKGTQVNKDDTVLSRLN